VDPRVRSFPIVMVAWFTSQLLRPKPILRSNTGFQWEMLLLLHALRHGCPLEATKSTRVHCLYVLQLCLHGRFQSPWKQIYFDEQVLSCLFGRQVDGRGRSWGAVVGQFRQAYDCRYCRLSLCCHGRVSSNGAVSLEPYPQVRAWILRVRALSGYVNQ
jgi:hypothetical protein